MAYFKTENPNFGNLWRVLQSKMLVYFMVIWYILWLFGMFSHVLVCCAKKNLATLHRTSVIFLPKRIRKNSNFDLSYSYFVRHCHQGCQMADFQFGLILEGLAIKKLVFLWSFASILCPFGIFFHVLVCCT
jgi:hypothetical protein